MEKHLQALFCLKRKKHKKIQELSSDCSTGAALTHAGQAAAVSALRLELPTSAAFFLAGRKGKFPPVTDKNNGFGASLGLQRL